MTQQPCSNVEVPYQELSDAALRGVIEAFVLREGTEYGTRDHSLDEKVAAVQRQLERGEAKIFYDPDTRAVELLTLQQIEQAKTSPASA